MNRMKRNKSPLMHKKKWMQSMISFVLLQTNYCLFLDYTVKVFDDVLLGLQSEEPKIYVLRRLLVKLLRNILSRFVKPSGLVGKTVDQVEYKQSYNIKSNSELIIGEAAKNFINNKESHLRQHRIDEFYKNVVLYFQELCDYLLKKLPIHDPLLSAAEVCDVHLKTSSKFADVEFFLDKFPCLLPGGSTKDIVHEQFAEYQVTDITGQEAERMDETWHNIGCVPDTDCKFKFRSLSLVMCGILTIPHSSAHCERVFSCVRKNRTEQRSCLGDDTLESLLVVKSQAGDSSKQSYFDATLDHVKGAHEGVLIWNRNVPLWHLLDTL